MAGVAKAIGAAALTLSGAQRAAVYRRPEDGGAVCLWSQGFAPKQADRAPAADGIESGPVLLAEQAFVAQFPKNVEEEYARQTEHDEAFKKPVDGGYGAARDNPGDASEGNQAEHDGN